MTIDVNRNMSTDRGQKDVFQKVETSAEYVSEEQALKADSSEEKIMAAAGVACPHCGAMNEAGAAYCASCGQQMGVTVCPNCGSELDIDADFCETCHRYIRTDRCSFCGNPLTGQEAFCPECGNPRGGIVCPTCHTLNDFAFCKRCGTALTEEARIIMEKVRATPEYLEMSRLTKEYDELSMELPCGSEREMARDEENDRLRERVLWLLAQDAGAETPVIPEKTKKRMSKEKLREKKEQLLDRLSEMLEKVAIPPAASPAKVRNYAMASKPMGVRLAWMCNYKGAMHSSPCGCAKPQLGGKWIILGKNGKETLVDDNK